MAGRKTSAQLLKEFVDKTNGMVIYAGPQYETLSQPSGVPLHRCIVELKKNGELFKTTAEKGNKKEAYQVAAEQMLRQLGIFNDPHSLSALNSSKREIDEARYLRPLSPEEIEAEQLAAVAHHPHKEYMHLPMDNLNDEQFSKHPVTELIEHCAACSIAEPSFSEVMQFGASHCPKIVVACRLGNKEFCGVANNKKKSKKFAAFKMLSYLKQKGSDQVPEGIPTLDADMSQEEEFRKKLLRDDPDVALLWSKQSECTRINPLTFIPSESSSMRPEMMHFVFAYQTKYKDKPLLKEVAAAYELIKSTMVCTSIISSFKPWVDEHKGGIFNLLDELSNEMDFKIEVNKRSKVGATNTTTPRRRDRIKQGRNLIIFIEVVFNEHDPFEGSLFKFTSMKTCDMENAEVLEFMHFELLENMLYYFLFKLPNPLPLKKTAKAPDFEKYKVIN